jgi:transcriptional regulator with XRE-family HTH domain
VTRIEFERDFFDPIDWKAAEFRDDELDTSQPGKLVTLACGAVMLTGALTTSLPVSPIPVPLLGVMRDAGRTARPVLDLDFPGDYLLTISTLHLTTWLEDPTPAPVQAVTVVPATLPERIQNLREASGLTWDQLGRLFGVSRRAVHLWATGGRMNGSNTEQLARLEAAVARLRSNTPDDRKLELFDGSTGPSLYDQLRSQHASRANVVAGEAASSFEALDA